MAAIRIARNRTTNTQFAREFRMANAIKLSTAGSLHYFSSSMKQWKLLAGTVSFGIMVYVNNDTQRVYAGYEVHMFPPKYILQLRHYIFPQFISTPTYRHLTCP